MAFRALTPGLLSSAKATAGGAFDPATLFASGEAGTWVEARNAGTFQTFSAITQAANGDPTGFALDLSQGAGYSGGAFTGVSGEYFSNGGFDTDTVWTKNGWTISGGKAHSSVTDAITQTAPSTISATQFFVFSLNITARLSGFIYPWLAGGLQDTSQRTPATGIYSPVVKASTITDQTIGIYTANSVSGIDIDSASLVRLPGSHARQTTSASRPTRTQSGSKWYFVDDGVDDALTWTAPADTYTVAYVDDTATVTILTGQSLSGATDILKATNTVAYLAVNRALTGSETSGLTTYMKGLAA